MTTDNGFDAWQQSFTDEEWEDVDVRAAWEAGRARGEASRDAALVRIVELKARLDEATEDAEHNAKERDAALARVRDLEAALNAKVDAELERQDEGAWKAAHEAQQRVKELEEEFDEKTRERSKLWDERDAALGMVATLREALRKWEHWYSEDSSEFNREMARGAGFAALDSTLEAARQHEERLKAEERERCAKVLDHECSEAGLCEACVLQASIRALGSEKP